MQKTEAFQQTSIDTTRQHANLAGLHTPIQYKICPCTPAEMSCIQTPRSCLLIVAAMLMLSGYVARKGSTCLSSLNSQIFQTANFRCLEKSSKTYGIFRK